MKNINGLTNRHNSSVFQALLDLATAADNGGDLELASRVRSLASDVSGSDVLSSSDDIFRAHMYPDTALQWAKLPLCSSSSYLLDTVSPDGLALYFALVRRVSSFSPFVAFKVATLVQLLSWSERKVQRIISELKDKGLIACFSSEYSRTYGLIYMLNPFLIDVAGTPGRAARYRSIWLNLTSSEGLPADDDYIPPVSDKLTIPAPDGIGRMNITIITNKVNNDL